MNEDNRTTLGQLGYETYGNTGQPEPWKTFDGRLMPQWEDLSASPGGRETQRRWEEAAKAIASQTIEFLYQ